MVHHCTLGHDNVVANGVLSMPIIDGMAVALPLDMTTEKR